MVSIFCALRNVLLASTVLAIPSSQLRDRRTHRRSNHRLTNRHSDDPDIQYYKTWSGAIWDKDKNTFDTITGTIKIPELSGPDGIGSAWVGIDGRGKCDGGGLLQAGVDFTMSNGQASYDAWYEWFPASSYGFPGDIDINAGNVINITVTASSATSGTAIMENLTTKQKVHKTIRSSHSICMASAEWIVEDYEGVQVPLVNFSTVTFNNATATGPSGRKHTPSGAAIAMIEQNGTLYTSVSTKGDTVTINYI